MNPSILETDKDAILALQSEWMKENEEVFKLILNQETHISNPYIEEKTSGDFVKEIEPSEYYVLPITITSGIIGKCFILFDTDTLSSIVDSVIGGDGSTKIVEFDEMTLSVLEEVINQITGTLVSILSEKLSRKLNVRLGKPIPPTQQLFGYGDIVRTRYDFQVEDLFDSKLDVIFSSNFLQEILRQIKDAGELAAPPTKAAAPVSKLKEFNQRQADLFKAVGGNMKVPVPEIKRIKDITLEMKAIFGKTKVNVKELFEMNPGKVLELDKFPDEPVELYINNKFVGYGEIVVVDDMFGIRLLEINKNVKY